MKLKNLFFVFLTVLLLTLIAGRPQCSTPDPDEILSRMTLGEKLGQLFMPGIMGREVDDNLRNIIETYHLGGVMLFAGRNVNTRAQTASLTEGLQEVAMSTGEPIPLLVCIDQEGGVGSHVNILTGGVDTVGNLALGASPYIVRYVRVLPDNG